ncbi:MAG: hypothetical protein ACXWX3_11085, partial [Actinomycetota bacterium]
WSDESGDIGAQAQELLAAETVAELGLTGSESVPADVVQDPVSGDNLGAFQFDGAQSPTEVLYARQETVYGDLSFGEVLGTNLVACVAGDTALGLEIVATVEGEGERYQQLWWVQRDGSLLHIYIDAADQSSASVLAEVFRTWEWSSGGEVTGSPMDIAWSQVTAKAKRSCSPTSGCGSRDGSQPSIGSPAGETTNQMPPTP